MDLKVRKTNYIDMLVQLSVKGQAILIQKYGNETISEFPID